MTETGPDLREWIVREVEEINDGVERAIERTVDGARDEIKEIIDSSGTGNTWEHEWGSWPHGHPGRTQSAPGRVASGTMGDAVKSRTYRGNNQVTGEAGWIDEWQDYFGYQENGFYHVLAGREIRGMYALHDAAATARHALDKYLDEELK